MLRLVVLILIMLKACTAEPQPKGINGTWKLIKLVNGFAQLEQTGSQIGYEETLEINTAKKSILNYRNAQLEYKDVITLDKVNDLDAIIYKNRQEYQWYNLVEENGQTYLVLYQAAPIGAILADGSNYYYIRN